MKSKRRGLSRVPIGIGIAFLISGILSLVFSIRMQSQILAFIGLGLTFWGALFLLVTPTRYVESSLLGSTAISSYATIDRIVKSLQYKGKGYYIPPYPKEAYLPEHLKGLKDIMVFLAAKNDAGRPSLDEMAEGKFLLSKSEGVLVTPPGLGLLVPIEKQLRQDLTKMSFEEVCEVMPRFFAQTFGLVKAMEMDISENQVRLKIFDSLYKDLYSTQNISSSVNLIGCPIVSAVACALAKASGKMVTIEKQMLSMDGSIVQVWFNFEKD